MMRIRVIRIILGGLLLLVGGGMLFGKEELFYFLAPNHRGEASVLVVEGWISEEALQQVVDELHHRSYEQIIVTSVAHDSAFRMYSQGGLIFDLAEVLDHTRSVQTLQVLAFGTPAGGIQAHAKVLVDTMQVGELTATDDPAWHTLPLPGPMDLDSVTIVYDNNRRAGKGDRDLYVYAIRLDTMRIPARHPRVRYDRGKMDGRNVFRTDYASIAEEATELLIAQGVDRTRLRTLTVPLVDYERTYASARAVKEYLSDTVTAITVFSESVHARRSWLVYQKILGDAVKVGIVAARSDDERPDDWWEQPGSRRYVLLQLVKYLYTRFFFYPLPEPAALASD